MTSPRDRPENEALLLCARRELAPDQVARLRALASGDLDLDYFYKLARRHSLVPLVFSQLEHSVKDAVPPDVLQRFRKDYHENAARNLIFADELTSLTHALSEAGIETIVFKGPALAVSAYGNLALRRFIDLDVMVRRADVVRAIEVLAARGYQTPKPLSSEQQELLIKTQHSLQFTRGRLIVELHWQVSSHLFASSVTAEELWQNVETVEVHNANVKTLATEDLLFSLCVHGSRHLWQRLAWICDIDRIIATRPQLDWTSLLNRARQARAERMFLLGPALAAHLLGTRLPETVTEAITRDQNIEGIAAEIRAQLFDGTEQQPASLGTIFRYNYRIRADWRSRVRYCRHMLAPTDSDLESVRLSRPMHFIYYLLRPFRLLRS
ncbi:MAG TPA: nucleotidyltransferase family protein [Pyrinomonadaceae bacterium]|nr:nucleotidyltransferase family protein [Pyrinomonadaceae bacterium]